jgi:hypothetical protein
VAGLLFARELGAQAWAGHVDTLPSGTVVISNPARGVWRSAPPWRIVEDLRIGALEGDEAAVFGRIASLAVDGAGRIYVLDRQAQDVRVFGPDGRHVRTVGRKGGGPGEFTGADFIAIDRAGNLWVADRAGYRVTRFDTSGTYLADHPRRGPGFFPEFVGLAPDGSLWDLWRVYDERRQLLGHSLFHLVSGSYRDTLPLPDFAQPQWQIVQRRGTTTMVLNFPVPFTAAELLAVDPSGSVWLANSAEYRLTLLDRTGDSARVVARSHPPVPVTPSDRKRAVARYRKDFEASGSRLDESLVPSEKPAMRALVVDDRGFLWVAPYTADDSAAVVFDIFDPDGRYLGTVPTPVTPARLRPLPVVRGTALYYVAADELDVQYVVRGRIEGRN